MAGRATLADYLTARFDIFPDSSRGDTLRANLKLIPLELDKVVKVVYYDYDRSDIRILGMRDLNEIAYFLRTTRENLGVKPSVFVLINRIVRSSSFLEIVQH